MKKFRRWLRNWLEERETIYAKLESNCIPSDRRLDSDRGINFTIYKASGGTIIETRFYDRVKDRHINSLYVVTDEHDLGQEISRILTMESLKI